VQYSGASAAIVAVASRHEIRGGVCDQVKSII
jgi:hypothetical protein